MALATRTVGLPEPSISNQTVARPTPTLFLHAAMWGELDVKTRLAAKIKENQTLKIDTTHDIDSPNPWYIVHKVTCVIYAYDKGPLQLLVTHDGAGVFLIHPKRHESDEFFDPPVDRLLKSGSLGEGMEILGIMWGGMPNRHEPISAEVMYQIYASRRIECSNSFFGFDGYLNEHKTCQVFWRMKNDLEGFAAKWRESTRGLCLMNCVDA